VGVTMECFLASDQRLAELEADTLTAVETIRALCGHWATPLPPHLADLMDDFLDLDKAWAAISALLTGDAAGDRPWPAAGAICGGELFGGEQALTAGGVAVIRLTAAQVREVAGFLREHPFEVLLAGLDEDGLSELRLALWDPPPEEFHAELDRYVRPYLRELTDYFDRAAGRRMAMLKMIG
jgi:hypothetical protein